MTDSERELKKERNRPSFRKEIEEAKGKRCVNCGSEESIQYHHIVPLCVGGTNNIDNLVPLCEKCHHALHNYKNVKDCRKRESEKIGRPSMARTEEGKSAIDNFIMCKIGAKEFKRIMKYGDKTKAQDCRAVKRRMAEMGITKLHNNVDFNAWKLGKFANEQCRGWIEKADGTRIEF